MRKYVRPVLGADGEPIRVRMPTGNQILPVEGRSVEWAQYWFRRWQYKEIEAFDKKPKPRKAKKTKAEKDGS